MVWCVIRVKIVKESKRSKVEGKSKEGSIVCVENAVCESVSLPCSDSFGVATGNFAIETCVTILFYALCTFYLIRWDRAGWIDSTLIGLRSIL